MKSIFIIVILINLISTILSYKNPSYNNNRNTIVHLFEWKFEDVAKECERFLAPKGFAGVQLSPVNENLVIEKRPWWERYQPISYKIASRSGNEEQFKKMVKQCNDVGIRIYIDVVFNHMTALKDSGIGTGSSTAQIFSYPTVPYNQSHFNPPCKITDYQNISNVRNCQLEELHDLNQNNEHVKSQIIGFLNHLVDIGVAGFRVDAAKHMWPNDLKDIYNKLKHLNTQHKFPSNTKPFIYQEVIDLGSEVIKNTDYSSMGVVTEFKYGATLGEYFRGHKKLAELKNMGPEWGFLPSSDALVFIDNHDNQRGHGAGGGNILTYKTARHYKMATAFMLAYPYGITRVMSSYAFNNTDTGPPADNMGNILSPDINIDETCTNGWVCEHRWRQVYNMIGFRNTVEGTTMNNWWDNGKNQVAFSRGNKGFVVFNLEGDLKQTLQTDLPSGTYCDIISGNLSNGKCTGIIINVQTDKKVSIEILGSNEDGMVAIHTKVKELFNLIKTFFN